ncbi:hypothetical protein MIND_00939500 [Mycena indigotica]|uniref:Uncharacterized protein n=1 Tax=Mycena indigotica TaxID=2126181 RepID=A0A8H6SDQ7_9AGAR|nr:uncharacterized protein MIND_00939500 [Mycena indigotica]KAF7297067.1 hypothetical protein MIND_00939500 [Mycena indigotica]
MISTKPFQTWSFHVRPQSEAIPHCAPCPEFFPLHTVLVKVASDQQLTESKGRLLPLFEKPTRSLVSGAGSAANFAFKVPHQPPVVSSPSSSMATPDQQPPGAKPRRTSLALPSSPRVVPAWNFRDDTTIPYARKGKMRKIESTPDDEEDNEGESKPQEKEKRQRRKWSPEETQMLVEGCQIHGVGNWKAILSDPNLSFDNRSPVDLKDRFRTYFPEAYRTHYPNARTHLPSSLGSLSSSHTGTPTTLNRSTNADGTPLFPTPPSAHPKRRPFTQEEDAALLAGFRRHGAAWATIAKEAPVFGATGRRSMDLRDRFRNAWPEEYERAGYKARPRVVKKTKDLSSVVKEELGEDEQPRGRARVGRSKTDEGLSNTTAGVDPALGPIRRRRRAHTSQGFKTMSMPCSDDEAEATSDVAKSDLGAFSFGSAASDFTFKFANPSSHSSIQQQAGEETAMGLVPGMQHLVVAPPTDVDGDEPMLDVEGAVADTVPVTSVSPSQDLTQTMPPPSPTKLQQAHFLHRRQEELASLGLTLNSSTGQTIGRSAWGPQDWFSANPRLDSSSANLHNNSTSRAIHSPPLSSSASFPLENTNANARDFFELTHGVMERYDLEQPALYGHLPGSHSLSFSSQNPNLSTAAAFSSPALSFHSSFDLDRDFEFDAAPSEAGLSLSSFDTPYSYSEAGTDIDIGLLDDAESEPGGWAGSSGGFRGFTHHSNTAGDLIFGARTHQPLGMWGGWGVGVGSFGRRPGELTGIAEVVRGGKEGHSDEEDETGENANGRSTRAEKVLTLDDLVDIPAEHEPDVQDDKPASLAASTQTEEAAASVTIRESDSMLELELETPGTPLLRPTTTPSSTVLALSSRNAGLRAPLPIQATVQTVHVHHHHHHHHHYHHGPPLLASSSQQIQTRARSVSVPPPAEAEIDCVAAQTLLSAPTTPSLTAMTIPGSMSPPTAFALDPVFALGVGQQGRLAAAVNAASSPTPAQLNSPSPPTSHGDTIYLPFLDLHYYGGGATSEIPGETAPTRRGGEALDLARSSSGPHTTSAAVNRFGIWPGLNGAHSSNPTSPKITPVSPIPLRQPSVPTAGAMRPLIRSMSGGGMTGKTKLALALAKSGGGTTPSTPKTSKGSRNGHQRGQSAVVRPIDLVVSAAADVGPETAKPDTSAGLPKGKRKRASWDGGGW